MRLDPEVPYLSCLFGALEDFYEPILGIDDFLASFDVIHPMKHKSM